jgi:hypothetical protein
LVQGGETEFSFTIHINYNLAVRAAILSVALAVQFLQIPRDETHSGPKALFTLVERTALSLPSYIPPKGKTYERDQILEFTSITPHLLLIRVYLTDFELSAE